MPSVVERKWNGAKVYEVDRVGQPLTPTMAQALREGRATPHLIARGLAQNPAPFVPPRAADDPYPLTVDGARIRRLLGEVPQEYVKPVMFNGRVIDRKYDTRYCPKCHAYVDVRLIAWDLYEWASDTGESIVCVNCLEREGRA